METKLIVIEVRYQYFLQWIFIGEDNEDGGYLNPQDAKGDAPKDRGDWEHWMACKTVAEMPDVRYDAHRGFYWESVTDARKALRVVKEALKQDRPMPDWAKEALAQGWTPPKGWKA